MNPVGHERLRDVLTLWGLDFGCVLPDISVQGSPERCLRRSVIQADGTPYLLEELDPATSSRKTVMARRLEHLAAKGLPVPVPRPGLNGLHVQAAHNQFWQLTPFLMGSELARDMYWRDAWRGAALAGYLVEMRRAARGMDLDEPSFDLRAYVRRIAADTHRLHPEVHVRLARLFPLLDRELAACARLPVVFSHGDPHPLNIIWGEDRILAAIDWEFCGPKCVLHDMALVLGCVGSEDEEALGGFFVKAFLGTLRSSGLLDSTLERYLPTWTLALRTAWLAEWLRREDMEMAEFEVFYMTTLAGRFFG